MKINVRIKYIFNFKFKTDKKHVSENLFTKAAVQSNVVQNCPNSARLEQNSGYLWYIETTIMPESGILLVQEEQESGFVFFDEEKWRWCLAWAGILASNEE